MAMRGVRYSAILLVLTVFAFWAVRDEERPAGRTGSPSRVQTVAFDNVYGDVVRLPVYVTLDDSAEQMETATCDDRTCTFRLAMTDDVHELLIAVVVDGKRSEPARVTLDTRSAGRD